MWWVVGSFFTCIVSIFRMRWRVLVNLLGSGCLCSNPDMAKDT